MKLAKRPLQERTGFQVATIILLALPAIDVVARWVPKNWKLYFMSWLEVAPERVQKIVGFAQTYRGYIAGISLLLMVIIQWNKIIRFLVWTKKWVPVAYKRTL